MLHRMKRLGGNAALIAVLVTARIGSAIASRALAAVDQSASLLDRR